MFGNRIIARKIRQDRGMTIIYVAVGMVFILGMAGLSIDLASLYVGRAQAQRAADAAALAGAKVFANPGCSPSTIPCSTLAPLAVAAAENVGNKNLIAGASPNITDADVTVDTGSPNDPRVTVVAGRTVAKGNPMPTYFVKMFGITTASVSASATAEAYEPSGTGPPITVGCLKPWILPNCDSLHMDGTSKCGDGSGVFLDSNGAAVHPGLYPAGIIGELLTIKEGSSSGGAYSSKYWPISLPLGSFTCPACAGNTGGSQTSSSAYKFCIECCTNTPLTYGDQVLPITGNMASATNNAVDCLINQAQHGNDTLVTTTYPFQVIAGGSNPNYAPGTIISVGSSSSTITVPIYDGTPLNTGNGNNSTTVPIIGFGQFFIQDLKGNSSGTVDAVLLNIVGAPGGNTGTGSGNTIDAGANLVPVRLIHN
jgi:Putative Flp pilus-assembly TadE/G-like